MNSRHPTRGITTSVRGMLMLLQRSASPPIATPIGNRNYAYRPG
jgi:hypothetical protein